MWLKSHVGLFDLREQSIELLITRLNPTLFAESNGLVPNIIGAGRFTRFHIVDIGSTTLGETRLFLC